MKELSVKGKLPWRLGATSYVIPGSVLENVQLLAGKVDNIQILYFESATESHLEHVVEVPVLRELALAHHLTYTVHLPSDIRLGAADPQVRQNGLDEILRIMESLAELEPLCYDLHLHKEEMGEPQWLEYLDLSLASLAKQLAEERSRVAVENIEYPFARIWPLVRDHGFSACLDLGHVLRYQHDWEKTMALLPWARHIHYHSCNDGEDHHAIADAHEAYTASLGNALHDVGFKGVVTLEMYDITRLDTSLHTLAGAWQAFMEE